jgi:plastocyanin
MGNGQAVITAVFDGPLPGGTPKGVEIYTISDINDPGLLGIASVNNGTGSSGTPEYTLPEGDPIPAGTYIYLSQEESNFTDFFGFAPDYVDEGSMSINGDDAVELYFDGVVIDVFGDVDMDGSMTDWEYMDGWASRNPGSGPDGNTFVLDNWGFSGVGALDGASDNASADTPVPLKTYGTPTPDVNVIASGLTFEPDRVIIDVNQTVGWENTGGVHNVNGGLDVYPNNPAGFSSGEPEAAPWTYQFTFTEPGIYNYQCDQHVGQGMVGIVVVRPPSDHYVMVENNFYEPRDITIEEGETITWINISGFHNVNGSEDAYPDNPEGFSSGGASTNWIYSHTFTEPGTYAYHCDPHLSLGMEGTVTVEDRFIETDLSDVWETNEDGIPVLEDASVACRGIVYGVNLRSSGLEFALINESNFGTFVFTFDDLGYAVNEGDEIIVKGVVGQFNGQTQINAEEIELLSGGNDLVDPEPVSRPTEATETSLISIEGLSLLPGQNWPSAGNSGNVLAVSGSDTINIRIDEQVDAGPAPSGVFKVTGLGTQFDNDFPFTDGYQILPRSADDIEPTSSIEDFDLTGSVRFFPNPASNFVTVDSDYEIRSYKIIDPSGRLLVQQNLGGTKSFNIPVTTLTNGFYMVELESENGRGVSRIIIER